MALPKPTAVPETVTDIENESLCSDVEKGMDYFKYPFNELLIWAVLIKQQEINIYHHFVILSFAKIFEQIL
ncbi:hypothetical protein ACH3XW_17100 [Acanthocheilonema viteae]